jgi:hypothetical protein
MKAALINLFISIQLMGCGDAPSKKGGPEAQLEAPTAGADAGLIDDTRPAEVDLQKHMIFDRFVSAAAKEALRRDFMRIERFDLSTGSENDAVLKALLQVQDLKGATMSSWLKERVRYLLNSDLSLYRVSKVSSATQSFEIFAQQESKDIQAGRNVAAIMVGAGLYKYSKDLRRQTRGVDYLMIEVNDSWVHANTQRNGVMQIGPALFDPNFQANPLNAASYANTAQRVDTLFHEARHADGNEVSGSLGFLHTECPTGAGIAEEMVGKPACDDNANGPYTVGARILKAYLQKCGGLCSVKDKSVLESFYLDSLSRVVKRQNGQIPVVNTLPEAGFRKVDIAAFALIPSTQR